MFIRNLVVDRAPEDSVSTGSGAPASTAPVGAPSNNPVPETGSTPPAPEKVDPAVAEVNDFRSRHKAEIEKMKSRLNPVVKPEAKPEGPKPLPADLVGKAPETPKPAEPVKAEEKKPEPVSEIPKPAEPVKAEEKKPEPVSETPEVFQVAGKTFDRAKLEEYVRFAETADAWIQKNGPMIQNIEAERANIQREKASIQEMRESPDVVILETLQKNPQLREKFIELAESFGSGVGNELAISETQKELESLKSLMRGLQEENQKLRNEFQQKQNLEQEQQRKQREQEQVNAQKSVVDRVVQYAVERSKQLGLSERVLSMVRGEAATLVQQGRLPLDENALRSFMDGAFNEIVEEKKRASEAVRGEYLQRKADVPVSPPQGGGTTNVSTPPARDLREAGKRLLNRVQALGG